MNNIERIKVMREKLNALKPTLLVIEDQSHLHRGHAGAKDGRGHFALTISSARFADKTKIAQHQLIYQTLGDLMTTDIHALSIEIS